MSETDRDISKMREDYRAGELLRSDLNENPLTQFKKWFDQACDSKIREPNAMTLSTIGLDGWPTARTVLLKDCDEAGFIFFTNYESRKAQELAATPAAGLLFLWKELERQALVRGKVEKVSREETESYFFSRPYDSRIGAHASKQSETIPDKAWLKKRDAELRERYPETDAKDCVPLPDFWGGYRVTPETYEFWQGQPGRLHDRFEYRCDGTDQRWTIVRLSP